MVAVPVAVGLLPVGVPTVYAKFPDWFQRVMNSGISAGCLPGQMTGQAPVRTDGSL